MAMLSLDDHIHDKLKEISNKRKELNQFNSNMKDIVAEDVIKKYKKEVGDENNT